MGSQTSFFKKIPSKHRYRHGGILRKERAGRRARPLSGKNSLHLVFKANEEAVKSGFRIYKRFALIHFLIRKYAIKFHIKISHLSIQGDHIHLHIRTTKRSNYQNFFRVVAGQIAQRFEKEGLLTLPPKVTDTPAKIKGGDGNSGKSVKKLWMYRPFTRVVMGHRDYENVQNYIQLNEKEALGEIPYRKERLKGLSSAEWELLWS